MEHNQQLKNVMGDRQAYLFLEIYEYTEYNIISGHLLPFFSLYSKMRDFESNRCIDWPIEGEKDYSKL